LTARELHKSLGDFAERIDASDRRSKDAISGLRLTVDGLVAKGVADAVPPMRQDPVAAPASASPSALSALQGFQSTPPSYVPPPPEPDLPPFLRTPNNASQQRGYSQEAPPPPPPFGDADDGAPEEDGYSLSALQTILSNTLSQNPPELDDSKFAPGPFDPSGDDPSPFADPQDRPHDFLAQARRAAQAAAERDMEPPRRGKRGAMAGTEQGGGRNLGRLAIIAVAGLAVVTGIVAVLFTLPGSSDDGVERPDPGASIGEMMNGHTAPPVPATSGNREPAQQIPGADFAPLPPATDPATGAPTAMAAPPNGLGVPTQPEPAGGAEFTAGTSALPGTTPKEAVVASLESGAVRGDAKSQYLLSLRYSDGRGVVKDDARAASLVTKAAQQGLAVAQYRLGSLYERGVGVDKNLGSAKEWYEKAARLGNRKAMHNLAVLLADSTAGQPNYKEAAHWFREGATYGLTDSQYNVAVLLEQGWGVQKNLKEATTWYAIAAGQGDTGAAERLEALKKTLPAPDIALALDAARKFKPKPMNPSVNDMPSGPG
jgi:localization factor PodJL